MTKPCNFPARVNARRVRALARMRENPAFQLKRKRPREHPQSREAQMAEYVELAARIVLHNLARGDKTKKDHSHMAKLRAS